MLPEVTFDWPEGRTESRRQRSRRRLANLTTKLESRDTGNCLPAFEHHDDQPNKPSDRVKDTKMTNATDAIDASEIERSERRERLFQRINRIAVWLDVSGIGFCSTADAHGRR